jgi:hypothetical protein
MGNWSEKQEEKREGKEKDKTRREKLAGYFFDTSKLILAGVVIGGITPLYSDNAKEINLYVIIAGVIATILLAWIANKILK